LDDFFTSLSVQPDLQRWRCLAKSGIAVWKFFRKESKEKTF
jgi:hypothetical protein